MTQIPQLIHRKAGLWVFDKPSGWVVHPTNDPAMENIVDWAQQTLPKAAGLAPINRIDRETSGLVLMSPSSQTRGEIGKWFADELVKKRYRCLVYGNPPPSGVIDTPLQDARRASPLAATTRFEMLESFISCAYLEVCPQTGRKHQIRRHLQGIGHAIVGEKRYKPKQFLKIPGFPGRLWLHAHWLRLPDGREFSAPLPDELEAHLAVLRGL
ncbi:MAG: RNA pseudouridine synthase [Bradymonadaceae bacterium]|nr:RNA pseudouridine synthase [Lujinxingiaceae bacterium]